MQDVRESDGESFMKHLGENVVAGFKDGGNSRCRQTAVSPSKDLGWVMREMKICFPPDTPDIQVRGSAATVRSHRQLYHNVI